jgi:hypothetical protein
LLTIGSLAVDPEPRLLVGEHPAAARASVCDSGAQQFRPDATTTVGPGDDNPYVGPTVQVPFRAIRVSHGGVPDDPIAVVRRPGLRLSGLPERAQTRRQRRVRQGWKTRERPPDLRVVQLVPLPQFGLVGRRAYERPDLHCFPVAHRSIPRHRW